MGYGGKKNNPIIQIDNQELKSQLAQKATKDELAETSKFVTVNTPIGFYAPDDEILFPKGSHKVVGDVVLIDDRGGDTGKVWSYYYTQTDALQRTGRRSASDSFEYVEGWSAEEIISGATKLRFYPKMVNGKWYAAATRYAHSISAGEVIIVSFGRLDGAMTVEKVVTSVVDDGNNTFVDNGMLWLDDSTSTWHFYYSTSIGGVDGIRHATCSTITGTWTVDAGIFLKPSDIAVDVEWLRSYSFSNVLGEIWVTIGAGTFKPTSAGADHEANVYIGKFNGFTGKPTDVKLIVDTMNFPLASSNFWNTSVIKDNSYAPFLFYDIKTDKLALFVNTGAYGDEQIVRLNFEEPYSYQVGDTGDHLLQLISSYRDVPECAFWLPEGIYDVQVNLKGFFNSSTPHFHSQSVKLTDGINVYATSTISIGGYANEEKAHEPLVAIIKVPEGGRRLYIQAKHTGSPTIGTSIVKKFKVKINPVIRKGNLWMPKRNIVASFAFDDFGRVDNATSLGTTTTGQTWQATNHVFGIQSNQAYIPSTTGWGFALVDTESAYDFAMECDMTWATSNTGALIFRSDGTDSNMWSVSLANDGRFYLKRKVNGSEVSKYISSDIALVDSTTYKVKVECRGTNIKLYLDGVLKVTISDSALIKNTHAGIAAFASATPKIKWDNFNVRTL